MKTMKGKYTASLKEEEGRREKGVGWLTGRKKRKDKEGQDE